MKKATILKMLDATVGALICKALGTLRSCRAGPTLSPVAKPGTILVIRPGGMGDMLVLLPILERITKELPQTALTIVCEKRNVEVLQLAGLAENALVYDANPLSFMVRLLRSSRDVALDTEQFHHFSAVFGLASRAPVRVGFKINPRRNALYTHLVNYALDGPEGEQFMRLLDPIGIEKSSASLAGILSGFRADLPDATAARLGRDGEFAVVHPGSSSRHKRWAPGKFTAALALIQKKHRLRAVLVGARSEKRLCEGIADSLRNAGVECVSLAGELDLALTAEVMRRARLFVGADSGLAHLAVALGVPAVVLFGPSDHRKWSTEDATHAAVRHALPCAPCFIFGYHKPCRSVACMNGISPDAVAAAAGRVLANAGLANGELHDSPARIAGG